MTSACATMMVEAFFKFGADPFNIKECRKAASAAGWVPEAIETLITEAMELAQFMALPESREEHQC